MAIAIVDVDDSDPLSLVAEGESGLWVSGEEVKDGAARAVRKPMVATSQRWLSSQIASAHLWPCPSASP